LAINDLTVNGDQPFVFENEEKQIYVLCNGEIYDFKHLCEKYYIELKSGSDCEVILHLYMLIGLDAMIKELSGDSSDISSEFSFCICEINKSTKEVKLFVGRDHAGTRMMYLTGNDEEVLISSELKGSPFLDVGYEVSQFRPRHYLEISNNDAKLFDLNSSKFTKWCDFKNIRPTIFELEEAKKIIREMLIKSVRLMTMGDRKLCCLLSGGLDSSLVAAILAEFCREHGIELYTFSIGLDSGSTDRPFAEMVARHIGSLHHHIIVTEKQCLEALEKIPYIIESIDITSNRASCLQYLVVQWISQNTDFKIVFCGDGSDELFASYKYFHNAPSSSAMHQECIRLVNDIHMYDGLRAGMCSTACGLEIRFAFLNKKLLDLVFSIDPELRMPRNGIEKWLLREAFATTNYLPREVLWRSKEAMSDGISELTRSWFEIIRDHVEVLYLDEELEEAKIKYIHMPIVSKESLHYRKIFEQYFGTAENTKKVIPYYWLPKWCGDIKEPSARVLSVYKT
jgi:asparagine synthase (glutamine-hydrolysing)